MKELTIYCLIICLINLFNCASTGEITLSSRFGIDYSKIGESEKQKVEDMSKVLDELAKENDNLQVQNKVKDIQIENREKAIQYHSIKEKERVESKGALYGGIFGTVGTVFGILIGFFIGKSSK